MSKERQPVRDKDFYWRRIQLYGIIMGVSFIIMLMFETVVILSDPGVVKWLAYSYMVVFGALMCIAMIMVIRYAIPVMRIIKQEKAHKEQQQAPL